MNAVENTPARRVHLVGSVPLTSAHEVFSVAADILGPRLPRIPDGETGPRSYWITSQAAVIHRHPAFEPDGHDWSPDLSDVPEDGAPKYRLKPDVDPEAVEIPSFGYADDAKSSYAEFRTLRQAGRIPADTRFQVSLPTPMAFYSGVIALDSQAAVAQAFERRLAQEVEGILEAVPHDDLAIQWDACLEILIWEGARPTFFEDARQACLDRLVALSELIPEPVQLGFHLCYGDFRHRHAVEPDDTRNMVTIANHLADSVERSISWVHMPVPRDRDDDAYFRPLADLRLAPDTQLFLGLVHFTDGDEGTRRRMSMADRYVGDYGIATECGLGRRDPSTLEELLRIHARCAG